MIKIEKRNTKEDVNFIEKTRDKDFQQYTDTDTLQESNPIMDVINTLDRDVMETDNLTSIDFNTRLEPSEIGNITALQMLHTLGVGGKSCSLIARSIKRHKVSLRGLGRTEKVQIMQGEREHEEGSRDSTLFGKIRGILGKNDKT